MLVDGGVPVGLFPGYDLRRPVSDGGREQAASRSTIRELQQQLVDLGFMASSGLTGTIDAQTSTAVLGFQKWADLPRDGTLGAATIAALLRATRPEPARRAPGRRIEVQLRRQLALLIEDNRVVRAVHISSGAGGATPTGSFRVYRKERYSWSVPFKVWLPWASYFTGGVAFHEFGSVPTYAASHGCIRVNHYDAEMLFGFAETGTPVDVFDEARGMTPPSAPGHSAEASGVVGDPRRRRCRRCVLVALGLPPDSRADDPPADDAPVVQPRPTELVVALSLGDPVLQAGVVRDGQVILARGLEVDIARNLARRLGIPRVRFVYVQPASRLLAAKVRPWHLVISSIRPTQAAAVARRSQRPVPRHRPGRRAPSRPPASEDARRSPPPDHVRRAWQRRGTGDRVDRRYPSCVRSSSPSNDRLLQLVQTGVCDAAVVDADGVGRLVAGRGGLLGTGHGADRVRRTATSSPSPAAARSP